MKRTEPRAECRCSDIVQPRVQATPDDKLLVCALIFDHTLVQNNNAVDPLECGDSVRDEEDRLFAPGNSRQRAWVLTPVRVASNLNRKNYDTPDRRWRDQVLGSGQKPYIGERPTM
jgi:hypothetical protein